MGLRASYHIFCTAASLNKILITGISDFLIENAGLRDVMSSSHTMQTSSQSETVHFGNDSGVSHGIFLFPSEEFIEGNSIILLLFLIIFADKISQLLREERAVYHMVGISWKIFLYFHCRAQQ